MQNREKSVRCRITEKSVRRRTMAGLLATSTSLAVVAAVVAVIPAAPTLAQTAGAGAFGTGDIIVTAQRREQVLQKVPVAVTAMGAEQLQSRQLNNLDQISGIAPNLVISIGQGSASSTQVTIRGSVTTNNTITYDPAVGVYLDGVYSGKASGSVFDIGDLERVEVLRGPQGTLFGRNTLAGAINFITRKPENKWRVEGEIGTGNYGLMHGRVILNAPLTSTLYVKLSGVFEQRDGFTKLVRDPLNLPPPLAHSAYGGIDDQNRNSFMAQLRWQPDSALTVDYSYDRSYLNEHPLSQLMGVGTDPAYDQLAMQGIGTGNIFDPSSPFYSGLPLASYIHTINSRPKETSLDKQGAPDRAKIYGHALTVSYDLGPATIKSITAYRNMKVDQGSLGQDVDGSPMAIALGGFRYNYHQFSEELQLTGAAFDDKLNYVLGAYYFTDYAYGKNAQSYFLGASNLNTELGMKSRAYALYGQVDYALTSRLTVTAGARWTSERKTVSRLYQVIDAGGAHFNPPLTLIDVRFNNQCLQPLGGYAACNPANHHTFSNVTPAFILAYEATSNINLYAKYSVGFRSGSYNADAGPSPTNPSDPASDVLTFYRPEKNKSIELGVKSRFFDRRLTVNVAAFYNTEVDKQVASFQAAQAASTINSNAGKGRVKGVEVEVDAQPLDFLHLYGSLGLLRAHFIHYLDTAHGGAILDAADNRYYARAPRTTLSGGVDITVFDKDAGRLVLSADAQYRSMMYALPGQFVLDPNFPLVSTAEQYYLQPATVVNARLRFENIPMGTSGLKGYAMLWMKNVTNQTHANNKIEFGPNFGGLLQGEYAFPRTYGVTLGFKY